MSADLPHLRFGCGCKNNLSHAGTPLLLEKNDSLPINQIARHVGMESTCFIREFRRIYGIIPGDYQRLRQINRFL